MAMNIFLPVLPMIGADLGVSDAVAQYVLTVFLAATALAQLFIGPLSDRYGRRPVLLGSVIIYFFSTVLCVFAPTIELLLIGRVLQASTAATMVLSRAIIRDMFDRAKAASMIGYVTMAMALMPMIAPSIGGFVGEWYGWRAPFVVLLAISVGLFALIYLDLGETHTPNNNTLREQMGDYWSLLKEPMIWGYFGSASLASGAYFAFIGGAPFVALKLLNMTPSALGLYMGLVAVGYMFGNFLTGRYSERLGIEPMMFYGGIVASVGVAVALALMTFLEPHPTFLFVPMLAVGMGNGMALPNANAGAISVRPDLAGSASGIGGFLQIGGGALLAIASGTLISVENRAMPLYLIMFFSSLAAAVISYVLFKRMQHVSTV